jgi:hypothetical protein
MHKSFASFFCGSALLVTLCGCGGSKAPVVDPGPLTIDNTTDSKEDLKKRLESFRRSGQLSSALNGMRESIEQLPDLDLSEELLKELPKLEKAKSPDEVKAIAKSMMSKL